MGPSSVRGGGKGDSGSGEYSKEGLSGAICFQALFHGNGPLFDLLMIVLLKEKMYTRASTGYRK